MSKIQSENPFFTGTDIPDEFFCDRKGETDKIISLVRNGSNLVLKAPRRIGKSSLIKHVFKQKDITEAYNTLYVDIYGTKNAADFHFEFQRALLSAPFAKGTRLRKEFEAMVKSASIDLGNLDTLTGKVQLPRIGFSPASTPKLPMPELFRFLENTRKPTLVVFDEFQQIQEYPERMAASLRASIQELNRTKFIFSGSSRHLLTTMFQMSNQPFYKSAVSMDLDILSLDAYRAFCQDMFRFGQKYIDPEAVSLVYHLFSGETYLMQELMKETYARTKTGQSIDRDTVLASLSELVERKDADYREILNRLDNKKERNTLFCIAAEGIAAGLTSTRIMKQYDLDNASSVQNALENLGENKWGLIDRIAKGIYVIQDRLFELWIASRGGYLELKIHDAETRFKKQREIQYAIPEIIPPKNDGAL